MNLSNQKLGFYLSTMKLWDFKILIFLFVSLNVYSQNTISGIITSTSGAKLSLVEIYNKTSGTKHLSDKNGTFSIEVSQSGTYDFIFYKPYNVLRITFISTAHLFIAQVVRC